jgi:hypothetical protein
MGHANSGVNQETNMPQSTKSSSGGKSHSQKETGAKSNASEESVKKAASKSNSSPTGPARHGEKKTTP